MSNRSRRDQRNSNRGRRPDRQGQMAASLRSIDKMQILEVKGILPDVPDVAPIHIKSDKVYTVQKKVNQGVVNSSTTVDISGAFAFRLNDLPDSSSYTAIFDAYRIVQATVVFIPTAIGSNSSIQQPLTTVIDYDDTTPLATLANILEYDSAMTTMVGQPHIRTINVRLTNALYSGAFSSFGQIKGTSQWVDVASPGVIFYGLKYFLPASTVIQTYSVYCTYTLQFKNTR